MNNDKKFMIYIPVKIKHQYFNECLDSIKAYKDKIILVEKPELTFSKTMNWIQQDAISRGLDLFFWMHADAVCEEM